MFDAAAISALKAKVAGEAVPNPSQFQVVASFKYGNLLSLHLKHWASKSRV